MHSSVEQLRDLLYLRSLSQVHCRVQSVRRVCYGVRYCVLRNCNTQHWRFDGGATQSRTGLDGFAIRCITDLLSRRFFVTKKGSFWLPFLASGAGKESRTLDLNLGKVALYQLSYSRSF